MKKQQRNSNLAKRTTATSILKVLSLIIILIALSGGDSYANQRKKFRFIITRPNTNVTTILRVYADNEEDARENVALNGWQIISVEEIPEKTDTQSAPKMQMRGAEAGQTFSISVSKVGEGKIEPSGDVSVTKGDSLEISFEPGPCDKVTKLIYNGKEIIPKNDKYTLDSIEKDGYIVAVFAKNGTACEDNGILSSSLKEDGAINFALGEYTKKLTDEDKKLIDAVKPDKTYVIIGYTDDVQVVPNKEYADNFQLSQKRAKFLLQKLADKGIKTDGIKTIGLGPAFPVAPNKKEGQPLNRRAVLYERR